MTTRPPVSRIIVATAAPKPEEPPVMSAVLPSMRIFNGGETEQPGCPRLSDPTPAPSAEEMRRDLPSGREPRLNHTASKEHPNRIRPSKFACSLQRSADRRSLTGRPQRFSAVDRSET